ncbi:MAG: enoyl-CoA hydratase, partial [Actinocatenispora sp.]
VTDRVDLERRGPVATLTLHNPRIRNALTWRMYEQLDAHYGTLAADRSIRVVVVRGAGGQAFAAGTDIAQFREVPDGDAGVEYEAKVGGVIERLAALPVPTVAAVEGPAAGAGLAIATACDLIVCTPDAVFGVPVARTLGNCISPVMQARLYACLGRSRALAMLLTAELLTAEQAREAGLVWRVLGRAGFDTHVDELADRIAGNAPLTLAAVKRIDTRLMSTADRTEAEDVFRMCYGSADFAEGVDAFLTKRAPVWQGR